MFGKYLLTIAHCTYIALTLKFLSLVLPFYITCIFTSVGNFVLFLLIASVTFKFTIQKYLNARINSENKAVLITGCDTGFGHMLAKRLDSQGYIVFASCYDPSGFGAKELAQSCSTKLKILPLDVTNDESVKNALKFVSENLCSSELWALVNNAGIHKTYGIEFTTINDYKENLEVNAIGPICVTKAFLPLLRQSRGRVVNLTSTAGRLPCAHLSAYSISKYALAGFNDCLRQELEVWGIRIISIEPDTFKTGLTDWKIIRRNMECSFQSIEDKVKNDYGEKYIKEFKLFIEKNLQHACPKNFLVINALENAISLEYPEIIYRPSRNDFMKYLFYIYEALPHNARDFAIKAILYFSSFPRPRAALHN